MLRSQFAESEEEEEDEEDAGSLRYRDTCRGAGGPHRAASIPLLDGYLILGGALGKQVSGK